MVRPGIEVCPDTIHDDVGPTLDHDRVEQPVAPAALQIVVPKAQAAQVVRVVG